MIIHNNPAKTLLLALMIVFTATGCAALTPIFESDSKQTITFRSKKQRVVKLLNITQLSIDGRTILIDPGPEDLNDNLRRLYKSKNEVEIWITHAHPDHAGNIGFLQEKTGDKFKLVCSELDMELLTSEKPKNQFLQSEYNAAGDYRDEILQIEDIPVSQRVTQIILPIAYGRWPKAKVHATYQEKGVMPPGVELLYLPGHTPGSVGFLVQDGDQKIMIIGDLLQRREKEGKQNTILSFNLPRAELDDALESLEKIRAKEPDVLIASHGMVLDANHFSCKPEDAADNIKAVISSTIDKYQNYKNRVFAFVDSIQKADTTFPTLKTITEKVPFEWNDAYDPFDFEKRSFALATLKSLYRERKISDFKGVEKVKAIVEALDHDKK